MTKVIKLKESDIHRMVKRVLNESINERIKIEGHSEVLSMYKNGETTGTWYFDQDNKRLCIEAKTRRSWCLSDSNPDLDNPFDSRKFKKGEKGTFTITSNDEGKTAILIIK
jgi:hypothetical protein